ncbi:MAG: hypothetical protein AMS18_00455 [Gemmatimonas sp. SG8_17]|nr:MAG: hypothetical protein AMS18_00455 [Gemmatimonas sp. SG8_17]
MLSLNKVVLCGHAGDDPEVRHTANGAKIVNVRIATTRYYQGETYTDWHTVTAWGDKHAEYASNFIRKGSHLYVEGRLNTRSWEDNDGKKQYRTEVVAWTLQLVGKKPESTQYNGGDQSQYSEHAAKDDEDILTEMLGFDPSSLEEDDDLPF